MEQHQGGQPGQKTAQLAAYIRDSLAAEGIEPGSREAVAWLEEHGTADPQFSAPAVDDQGGMSEVNPMADEAARLEAEHFGADCFGEPDAGR